MKKIVLIKIEKEDLWNKDAYLDEWVPKNLGIHAHRFDFPKWKTWE